MALCKQFFEFPVGLSKIEGSKIHQEKFAKVINSISYTLTFPSPEPLYILITV